MIRKDLQVVLRFCDQQSAVVAEMTVGETYLLTYGSTFGLYKLFTLGDARVLVGIVIDDERPILSVSDQEFVLRRIWQDAWKYVSNWNQVFRAVMDDADGLLEDFADRDKITYDSFVIFFGAEYSQTEDRKLKLVGVSMSECILNINDGTMEYANLPFCGSVESNTEKMFARLRQFAGIDPLP